MKKLMLILIFLTASVWIGLKLANDPGYALFAYQHWRVEMPLWVFSVCFLFSFILLSTLLMTIRKTLRIRKNIRLWNRERHQRRAQRTTNRGLIEYAEGNWKQAENSLIKSAKRSHLPLINYLLAARAAQEQGAHNRRDDYLRKAYQCNPKAQIAIGLGQAQLQLAHHQHEQALATLQKLKEIAPHHRYVLKLLLNLYKQVGDWENLLQLLPVCQKNKVITKEQRDIKATEAYYQLLQQHLKNSTTETIENFWKRIPKPIKNDTLLIEPYVHFLIKNNWQQQAEKLVAQAIHRAPNDNLFKLYGLIQIENSDQQLKKAEKWLRPHDRNPSLLLTLGKLCMHNQLWGKAQGYLQESLQLKQSSQTSAALGEVFEKLNKPHEALTLYRQSLQLES